MSSLSVGKEVPAPGAFFFVSPLRLGVKKPANEITTIGGRRSRFRKGKISASRSSAAARRRRKQEGTTECSVVFGDSEYRERRKIAYGGGHRRAGMRESDRYDERRELMLREREDALGKEARMMMAPQIVGVLLKKPGQQTHPRLPPLDPQETKIKGEFRRFSFKRFLCRSERRSAPHGRTFSIREPSLLRFSS